jgi:hypothetical protein
VTAKDIEYQFDENVCSHNITFASCERGARNHGEITIAVFFSKRFEN